MVKYDPAAQRRFVADAGEVDEAVYESIVVEVATVSTAAEFVFVIVAGAFVEVVAIVHTQLERPAAVCANTVPEGVQLTNESVMMRSLASLLRIEVDVAEALVGATLIAAILAVLNVVPVGEPNETTCDFGY